jgi:hypothetical protein
MGADTANPFWQIAIPLAAIWLPIVAISAALKVRKKSKTYSLRDFKYSIAYSLLSALAYTYLPNPTLRIYFAGISLLFCLLLFVRDRFL